MSFSYFFSFLSFFFFLSSLSRFQIRSVQSWREISEKAEEIMHISDAICIRDVVGADSDEN